VLGTARCAAWAVEGDLAAVLPGRGGVDRALLAAAAGFSAQSLLKHALTEADRIVLAVAATPRAAGLSAPPASYGTRDGRRTGRGA